MQKVLVIVGPTAVGKTSMSVQLAKHFDGEIISGDSIQVYHHMNIGSAKITPEEMDGVPHYLVDCFEMHDEYSVKVFQEKSRAYIQDMSERNKLPIICGGTGLYIKSVIYDYQFIDQERNQEFTDYLRTRSRDELWSLLKIIDPKACEELHPNNRQRVVRALCMAHDGDKKSDLLEKQEHKPIYDVFVLGLTMDRARLYERINYRVDLMMEKGLFQEIESLVPKYENIWDMQCFKGIGYKEWKGYFDGTQSVEECAELVKKNSRNFAKRQYTWFNNQMDVHWYDIEEEGYKDKIKEDLTVWLNS